MKAKRVGSAFVERQRKADIHFSDGQFEKTGEYEWTMTMMIESVEPYETRVGSHYGLKLTLTSPRLNDAVSDVRIYTGMDVNGNARVGNIVEILLSAGVDPVPYINRKRVPERRIIGALEGREVVVNLLVDRYDGKTFVRVSRYLPTVPPKIVALKVLESPA